MTLRAVIVDDEPLPRERIRTLLREAGGVEVVAECGDGAEAVRMIEAIVPDLVFLDIQMPELDGFDVLDALAIEPLPAVIFVTAYDEYAVRAFDVNAVDYLLKPVEPERFAEALARVRERRSRGRDAGRDAAGGEDAELRALVARLRAERGYVGRFVVRSGSKIYFVRAPEVDWIESAGNYARLHAGGHAHLIRETMKSLEARLDPDLFVRVHRSAIVNVDRIVSLEPYFHGEYVVTMRDGTKLTSSRSHSARLRALLR